jgi:CheY-like chemotaxis protein
LARIRGRGETILVVEDDPAVLEVTTRMLRRNGYTVLEAASGGQAVSIAARDAFELLLTDSVMPQMPGHDLAELLRETYPGICVLFMSGYSEGVLAPHRVLGHGTAFIQKPFNERALIEMVSELLTAREATPPRLP